MYLPTNSGHPISRLQVRVNEKMQVRENVRERENMRMWEGKYERERE